MTSIELVTKTFNKNNRWVLVIAERNRCAVKKLYQLNFYVLIQVIFDLILVQKSLV